MGRGFGLDDPWAASFCTQIPEGALVPGGNFGDKAAEVRHGAPAEKDETKFDQNTDLDLQKLEPIIC